MKKQQMILTTALALTAAFTLSACQGGSKPAATTAAPKAETQAQASQEAKEEVKETEAAADIDFPTKSITLIVNASSGGSGDLTAQALSAVAEKYLGVPLVVELHPGASGGIGMEDLAKAKPDGYTLCLSANQAPTIFGNKAPDLGVPDTAFSFDDFAAVCKISSEPLLICTNKNSGWQKWEDMVKAAEAEPGKYVWSSSGLWGSMYIPFQQFLTESGINLVHLPCSGGGPALTALLNGDSVVSLPGGAAATQYLQSGDLIALASTSSEPWQGDESLPTLKDLGYNVDYKQWNSIFAPAGTDPAIIQKLSDCFGKLSEDEDYKKIMSDMSYTIDFEDAETFDKNWKSDIEKYTQLLKDMGWEG